MKRLGKFTGEIYPDDYDFSNAQECCVLISDEDAENKEYLEERRAKDLIECLSCGGCPESRKVVIAERT